MKSVLFTPIFLTATNPQTSSIYTSPRTLPRQTTVWSSICTPTVIAYGAHDKVCPFKTAKHLVNALKSNNVDYKYYELPHSGHALQNDDGIYEQYMKAVNEYLAKYMPVA